MITVGVSADLEANYHAGNIVKELGKKKSKVVVVETQVSQLPGGKNLAGIENVLNKAEI